MAGAQAAQTVDRYDLNSTREDLSDMIYNTDPVDTMFMSSVGREKSNNITKEWSVDVLTAATDNKVVDGGEFAGDTLTTASKLGNYHQISRRDLLVSRRADIVNKPGRRSETAYQIMKEMKTLKNSVEMAALLRKLPKAGSGGVSGTAPESAGVPAWIKTHVNGVTSGNEPTLSSASPAIVDDVGTIASATGLTEAKILGLKSDIYTDQKDNANLLMLSPVLKQSLSGYLFSNDSARIARPEQNFGSKGMAGGATVMGSVQFWQTDFGTVRIVPSRFIPAGNGSTPNSLAATRANRSSEVLLLNPEYWAMSYLTGFTTQDIPKSGDNRRKMLLVDWTVVSKNESASGCITGINENTAVA